MIEENFQKKKNRSMRDFYIEKKEKKEKHINYKLVTSYRVSFCS